MPVPTFDELMVPLTLTEWVDGMLGVAEDIDLPVTSWQPLSVAREMIYIDAAMLTNHGNAIQPTIRGGLIDYAEGDWLTILADQVYEVERIESSPGTGLIRLTESEGTPHTFAPGDVRVLNETRDKTYTNTTGGTLSASGTLDLSFIADESGSASDLVSGDTLSLVTSITGVEPVWIADLLGQDRETDPALRIRCRDSNAKASPNGPAAAYDYFAKSTLRTDGTNVGVTRTNRVEANGTITLWAADADGVITAPDIAFIQSTIDLNVVPTGLTATVVSATTNDIAIAMTLRKAPGSTAVNGDLEDLVTAAITEYFSSINVGGDKSSSFQGIYISTLITLARVACGTNVDNVVISSPAADVALANNEVPVIDGTIAFTWI